MGKVMKNKWELTTCGNYVKFFLKNEFYTLIDFETLNKLIELNRTWGLTKSGERYYIHAVINGKKERLHRFIMGFPSGLWVDHINHNTFDNRTKNLRIVTPSENIINKSKKRTDNSTGVTGVYFDSKEERYKARVWVDGKAKWVGQYKTIEEAEEAMKQARNKYYGGFGNGVL